MEEKRIIELKERAKHILSNTRIDVSVGDERLVSLLQEIEKKDITEEEIDLIEKTINNIENYFYTKAKMQIESNDYEYLKKIAEILRNQKIRIEDNVILGQPVFKVILGEEEVYYFITRDSAKKFIEAHPTAIKKLEDKANNVEANDRRKDDLMEITTNKNLEIGRIIDIIKRNY